MKKSSSILLVVFALLVGSRTQAIERQKLHNPTGNITAQLAPTSQVIGTQRLHLTIGLPLRNQEALTELLRQLYDPASPNYRHFLTPDQFTANFGPSEQDYQTVIQFAQANGFTIKTRHPNRMLVDVEAPVSTIENTFQVTLHQYQHPKEARNFYAPNTAPTVALSIPISNIGGLDNYSMPHPNSKIQPMGITTNSAGTGSGPSNTFAGGDFRAAYAPGVTLTGAGQNIGLVQFDGYYASDISAYKNQFGIPDVPLINVPINGGVSSPGKNNMEVCLDIEMALAMAPGVSAIYVYEGVGMTPWEDILSKIANDNICKQISCSWNGGYTNPTREGIFLQMAAQGQSFFVSSGDQGAFTGVIGFPSESPNITVVGGTQLTTTGSGGSYVSETVWNRGSGIGGGGGISGTTPIPTWQQSVSMATNQGSTTMRNLPDVALIAENVYIRYGNGVAGNSGGTSVSAPLWAGFMALVNQRAVANGRSTIGFINPTIYALGTGTNYSNTFHDTTTGNNFWASSPTKYAAVTGFDLCTGWGTPIGGGLIDALAGPAMPIINEGNPLPAGVVNTAYNQTLTASNGVAPYVWAMASGSLPNGLSLSGSGIISGTATTTGTASFSIQLTDNRGLSTITGFNLVIYPSGTPLISSSTPLPTATIGANYNQALTATGGALPYTWTLISGTLPSGISLTSNGLIGGTATATGFSSFTLQVTGSDGLFSTTSFNLTVAPQKQLLNSSFETGDFSNWTTSDLVDPTLINQVYTNGYSPGNGMFTCAATDGSYSVINGFSGFTTGTTRIAQDVFVSGSAPILTFDYRAGWDMKDFTTATHPRTFSLTVQTNGGGSPLGSTTILTASNGTVNPDTGPLTGVVNLSAYIGTTIRICFDEVIQDAGGSAGPGFFELDNVRLLPAAPPVISTWTLPSGLVGTAYNQTLVASGGITPYGFAITSGSLPAGLSLSGSGVLSGTPSASGSANFNVQVTGSNGMTNTKAFTLSIYPPRVLYFPMNTDPGWTCQGLWAFGHPTGGGGWSTGHHDPTAGATGTNVYGVNLAGDYSIAAPNGPFYLIAGPFDFSNVTGTVLQFQRWLNSYYNPYATHTIEVSNNGTDWTTIYTNPATPPVQDATWTQVSYDISSIADGHASVYVRWGYQIFNYAMPASGWNVDDVAFLGFQSPYALWQNLWFTSPELANAAISGYAATPAGDGISNLMKYALNLNPKTNGIAGLPIGSVALIGGSNYLTLSYTKVISASDITYLVQVSGDLQSWSSATSPVSLTNNLDGTTQTVVVKDLIPTSTANKRFIRLKISKP